MAKATPNPQLFQHHNAYQSPAMCTVVLITLKFYFFVVEENKSKLMPPRGLLRFQASKYLRDAMAAGAPTRTALRELKSSLRRTSRISGKGGGNNEEGKDGWRKGRVNKGRGMEGKDGERE